MVKIVYILSLLLIPNLQTKKSTQYHKVTPMSEKIIQLSKITSNRQVSIPVEIMKKMKVKAGDKILWIERNGDIIIRKV
jgi:AbrB family looped-hinge helix DNA binding protein